MNKKRKESHGRKVEQKEMWFKVFIDTGDLQHKFKKVREFLAEKNPVKLTIKAKGRVHRELLTQLLNKILLELQSEIEVPETPAKFEGHNLSVIVHPVKNKKNEETKVQNTQSNSQKVQVDR